MIKLFVYGTLMQGHSAHDLLSSYVVDVKEHIAEGVTVYTSPHVHYPMAKKEEESRSRGQILTLNFEDKSLNEEEFLEMLDYYEGVPQELFERQVIRMDDDEVYVYLYHHSVPYGAKPAEAWSPDQSYQSNYLGEYDQADDYADYNDVEDEEEDWRDYE